MGNIIKEFPSIQKDETIVEVNIGVETSSQEKIEPVAEAVDSAGLSEVKDTVETTPVVFIPEILSVTTPVRDAAGKYSFEVKAVSADEAPLNFVLYSDKECSKIVLHQNSNIFKGVEPTASTIYYLVVINAITGDVSVPKIIKGFTKPVMYEKVQKADLEKICNSGDYEKNAPDKYSHRFSPMLVIEAKGMRPDEKPVANISDICLKIMMDTWASVVVEELQYDSQNRVKKLVIVVNY